MYISHSDIEHLTELAEVLEKAYGKVINTADITDSRVTYDKVIDVAKNLRHMALEARELAIKLALEREGGKSNG